MRARSAQAKQDRRIALLEAAARLLANTSMSDIRMDDIAREADVSKGTLYLYFRQRDEIFLTLAYDGLIEWLQGVESDLRADLSVRGADMLAAAFSSGLRDNLQLMQLLALVPALRTSSTPETPGEVQAALALCSRRIDKIAAERLYAGTNRVDISPSALTITVLLGVAQLSTLGMSLNGYSSGGADKDGIERLLAALFKA